MKPYKICHFTTTSLLHYLTRQDRNRLVIKQAADATMPDAKNKRESKIRSWPTKGNPRKVKNLPFSWPPKGNPRKVKNMPLNQLTKVNNRNDDKEENRPHDFGNAIEIGFALEMVA
jgi:hypothetical protein